MLKLDVNYVSQRMTCTESEKEELLETVKLLLRIKQLVAQNGILYPITMGVPDEPKDDPFYSDCLALMSNGHSEETLSEFYAALLVAGNYTGKEFLRNLLIAEGLLSVACGQEKGRGEMIDALSSRLGVGWRKRVEETFEEERKRFKEARKAEMLERMKILGLPKKVINAFRKNGTVNEFEPPVGCFGPMREDTAAVVAEFESKYDALVYTVVRDFDGANFYDVLLFVSRYEVEWESDRRQLEEMTPLAYVYSYTYPCESELGSVRLEKTETGGIIRTE